MSVHPARSAGRSDSLPLFEAQQPGLTSLSTSSWLDVDQASALSHDAPSRTREAITTGELRGAVIGGITFIHVNWLRSWLASRQSTGNHDHRIAAAGERGDVA